MHLHGVRVQSCRIWVGLLALEVAACTAQEGGAPPLQRQALDTAASVLLIVGESPNASDLALKARLESLCQKVVVRSDEAAQPDEALTMKLVVISESARSFVIGTRLNSLPVPLLVTEPALFDEFGMTGQGWGRFAGDALEQTQVEILAPASPLAAGLVGVVNTTNVPTKFVWGAPGPAASVVAQLPGQPGRAAVFSYEADAEMVSGLAPARRVGFFHGRDVAEAMTPEGFALFDAAVLWLLHREAALVVGNMPLSASDQVLHAAMRAQRLAVGVQLDAQVQATHVNDLHLAVISESTLSSNVGTRLTEVAAPLLVLEPSLFDDFKLTGPSFGIDYGDAMDQRALEVPVAHELSGGLQGRIEVTDTPQKFVWAASLPFGAEKVASLEGRADRVAIFRIGAGVARFDGSPAPADRVGWFAGRDAAIALNTSGRALLQAALESFVGAPACPSPSVVDDGFDEPSSEWLPEQGAQVGWNMQDVEQDPASGALVVHNGIVLDRPFLVLRGGFMCLPLEGVARHLFSAEAYLPASAPPGARAGIGVFFYGQPGCAGSLTPGPIVYSNVRGAWDTLSLDLATPSGAQSVAVRLLVLKAFTEPATEAWFDDVKVTAVPAVGGAGEGN